MTVTGALHLSSRDSDNGSYRDSEFRGKYSLICFALLLLRVVGIGRVLRVESPYFLVVIRHNSGHL